MIWPANAPPLPPLPIVLSEITRPRVKAKPHVRPSLQAPSLRPGTAKKAAPAKKAARPNGTRKGINV